MLLTYITFFSLMLSSCSSLDTLTVFQNITDGETIVSGNERFELGFFSPGSSKNRYLGIWYKNTSPHVVLWVANRETPLIDTSGVVKLDSNGNLSLVSGSGFITWSSNSSASGTNVNPIAKFLDTGNFVIMNENLLNKENYIWQSFDHPRDTLLPGMKLGKNFVTGREAYLTSWRSTDDPSTGEYTFRFLMVNGKYIQLYTWKSSVITTRIGPYTGMSFAGHPNYNPDPTVRHKDDLIVNQNEMYYMYTYDSPRFLSRSVLTPDGKVEISQLNLLSQEWIQYTNLPVDFCDNYGLCGPYGICSISTDPNCGEWCYTHKKNSHKKVSQGREITNIQIHQSNSSKSFCGFFCGNFFVGLAPLNCGCLKCFELKNAKELNPCNMTSGCQQRRTLDCGPEEGLIGHLVAHKKCH